MSALIKKIFAQKQDLLLNRNIGTFSWVLHRVTGLILASYIFMHLIVLGSNKLFCDNSFNFLMGQFEVPIFKVLELCLVGVIFFHGFNGVRVVIADFAKITRLHKILFWIIMVIFIGAMALTGLAFLPHIIK
jgi:succinate dehydrogenase / fumarate reductase, cytochrome b subunit